MKTPLLLALIVVAFAACANPGERTGAMTEGGAMAEPPEQWAGAYGGAAEFSTAVATSQADWERFWNMVSREAPRAIDAGREIGVMLHLGWRNTGGHGIEVQRVYVEGERCVVEFSKHSPPPGAMVTQALTNPWVIAIVPASEFPIEFRERARRAE